MPRHYMKRNLQGTNHSNDYFIPRPKEKVYVGLLDPLMYKAYR